MTKLPRLFRLLAVALLAAAVAIAGFSAAGRTAPASAGDMPGAVGRVLGAAEPDPIGPAPPNFRWHLLNPHPCVRDTVTLVVASYATPCDSFAGATVVSPTHVIYHSVMWDSVACPAVLPRIRPIHLTLGVFPAGPQKIVVEWVIDIVSENGDIRTEVRHTSIDFVVSEICSNTGRLPYVEHVQIGPPGGGIVPCAPPGDSIQVGFSGHFPNGCFSLRSIELVSVPTTDPMIGTPRVRLTVEDCACCTIVCDAQPEPWRAAIKLPPLPPSAYKLGVELVRTSCNAPVERFAGSFPFMVSDSCGPRPPARCLIPVFAPGETSRECNARIAPDQPARLTLLLNTPVAIAGLQGELSLDDPALRITRLAPAGAAEGMLLRWTPTERGARFTMFSDQGAVIPPAAPGDAPTPILAIGVEVRDGHRPPPATLLLLTQFLASDPEGHEVPGCSTHFDDAYRFVYARICAEPGSSCDFNQDGREDIRDLVLMIRCLRDLTLCAGPADFDCNGDQAFTLDDVLCCAEGILRVDCPGCPPGETRKGDVKVTLGPPVGRSPSLGVPVRIEGAGSVGGARLAIRFPSDRYEVSGVDYGGVAASWLQLSEVSGNRVLVGLIDAVGAPAAGGEALVTLRLALKPGREPGGVVSIESADLTAHDGVRLEAEVPLVGRPLDDLPRLALSESRPNPFAAVTTFSVTVDRPGPVEVAIFDLGGRRVATIHRGELPAGTREFSWDGRAANGTRARDGVYFYHASAGTETLSRKLVLLRRP